MSSHTRCNVSVVPVQNGVCQLSLRAMRQAEISGDRAPLEWAISAAVLEAVDAIRAKGGNVAHPAWTMQVTFTTFETMC